MPTSKSLVLFSDDFSDPNSGWDVSENSAGQVAYKNGHYSIKTYLSSPYCTYGEINRYFSDFILEVETWLVSGTDNNWHTVSCRVPDNNNFYQFSISADGYYVITKIFNGEQISLVTPTQSSYVNQVIGAVNLIHIECISNSLSLSVNGHLLRQVTDNTFSGGDISLEASESAGISTEIAFDNLVITEP